MPAKFGMQYLHCCTTLNTVHSTVAFENQNVLSNVKSSATMQILHAKFCHKKRINVVVVVVYSREYSGADPGIFERGGPEAIIYKILERGGPKSLKMAFECSFQSLSYKSFANIPQKGGAQAPSPKSATDICDEIVSGSKLKSCQMIVV